MAKHPYRSAQKHLMQKVPELKALIEMVGPCTLQPNSDGFSVLVRSIVSQQISTKAAHSISSRLVAICGKGGLRPAKIAKLADEELRSCGLSFNKLLSIRSLSQHFLEDPKLHGKLESLTDEEVHDHLIPIRGIGPWTVQMFLIFSLGRLDILPVADLGLRAGVRDIYALSELPPAALVTSLAEPWKPYRSIATWYLWRSKGVVPQSK